MTSLGRRAALSGALALLALAALPAGPASAHATVAVTSPASDQELITAGSTVTGQVSQGSHSLWGTSVESVTLTLALDGRPDITASDTPSGSGAVSFPVNLTYNGKYEATMRAPWKHTGLDSGTTGTASSSMSFLVAVPPARPTDVKTAADATSRAVAVTWKANAEPDLIRYEVKRAKGTSNDFTVVGKVNKAAEPTFVDSTTAEAGGDYRYLVVAVRNGIPGRAEIVSDPSSMTADTTVKVPDPPPPPTTAAQAGTVAPGAGGTASTVPAGSPGALATSGNVDLSGFNTVRSQTRPATPRTVPLPDPGFQSTLPFATPDPSIADDEFTEEAGDLGELAADSPEFRELGAESESDDRARTMAIFAAGLLSTVLLMHVLWVKSEVKRVPLEALDPEGPLPAAGSGGATGRRAKRARAVPGPTLEDALEADFSPVVVAPNGNGKGRSRPGGSRRQKVATGA